MKRSNGIVLGLLITAGVTSCWKSQSDNNTDTTTSSTTHPTDSASTVARMRQPASPDWAKNATIYEVNLRQFAEKEPLKALESQLTRLKEMGVDVLWLMPVFPIGAEKRKGTLGNPYAVRNYRAINPEYGTDADFRTLVQRAHDLGMRIILDWPLNHTAWDHPWVSQHPDWYTRINGRIISPVDEEGESSNWTDVADLNYDNLELRQHMLAEMKYWVKEYDVDGFRCEVASMVPDEFWAEVRPTLDSVKTVFMLAESEDDPSHFRLGFNANYGWSTHWLMREISRGRRKASDLDSLLDANRRKFPSWYYQMHFIQNHDENTWAGTTTELFGQSADAFSVLTFTFDGMPLVYNGMESKLSKRLKMYEKDPIYWGNYGKQDFYKTLLTLKHRNRALWNGPAGGPLVKLATTRDDKVYAFHRQKDGDMITVVVNLSPEPQTIQLTGDGFEGMYTEVFSRQPTELRNAMTFALKPWEYKVFTN
ncbi:alpha-amylase family glycosyl hydrolase [Tellurirhabdus rosea]|uniref:alpha-amylase family glycosyl hydrolase n=1 Tax=Tellurirhabdus rosea TaxID=2674997 RepID=UPI00224E63D3|nr:alpha-amylase family glycosyl hydrolase [Tellurirhabdus rosea]